jgi:hypothetical protein
LSAFSALLFKAFSVFARLVGRVVLEALQRLEQALEISASMLSSDALRKEVLAMWTSPEL